MTMTSRSARALAGLFLVAAATASAQFKSIGPDGRVTYSDLPPPAGSRIVDRKQRDATATDANPPLPFEVQQALGKYPVTLYTGDRCPPCDEARSYLRNRGVPFTERTVSSDEDIALFRQTSPDGTAPVVVVGTRRSVGFSQVSLSSLLDAAGYPSTPMLPRDYRNAAATPLSPTTRAPAQSITQNAAPAAGSGTSARGGATMPPPPAAGQPGFRF